MTLLDSPRAVLIAKLPEGLVALGFRTWAHCVTNSKHISPKPGTGRVGVRVIPNDFLDTFKALTPAGAHAVCRTPRRAGSPGGDAARRIRTLILLSNKFYSAGFPSVRPTDHRREHRAVVSKAHHNAYAEPPRRWLSAQVNREAAQRPWRIASQGISPADRPAQKGPRWLVARHQ